MGRRSWKDNVEANKVEMNELQSCQVRVVAHLARPRNVESA